MEKVDGVVGDSSQGCLYFSKGFNTIKAFEWCQGWCGIWREAVENVVGIKIPKKTYLGGSLWKSF